MSETIKKAASLIIALLAIVLIFLGWNLISGKIEKTINDAGVKIDTQALASYTNKDGSIVSGSTVLNFITEKESSSDKIAILVKTKKNTTGVYYVYNVNDLDTKIAQTTEDTNKKNAKSKSNKNFISPAGEFEASIVRDANDSSQITTIVFTQK